ncbi:MAG TPA: alginate lyase family protein [Terriglobales bacterium]|nr:alginate lyase family protein [Terriglobales bacterium]
MMKRVIVVSLIFASALTDAQSAPRVFLVNPATLMSARTTLAPAVAARLRADAEKALQQPLMSVVDKSLTPPSGDKHDYMSMAPYWWPDPSKPDGLPYIRRDGETNPEIRKISDHDNFGRLVSATHTLALAYYLLGDERYAAHAAELLRAWFLTPATRMNPNLTYAQAIRGINDGRGIGLIETRGFPRIVDAVGMLAGSRSWTAADQRGMERWCAEFVKWLRESKNGKDEAAAKNNHGTWYDGQLVALALFTHQRAIARAVLNEVRSKRIAVQIEPDGRQPLELARTKSFGYSVFNLNALVQLARLGEGPGIDLWNARTADGRSLRAALDFLIPFTSGDEKWPYEQIADFHADDIVPALLAAAVRYNDPRYTQAAARIDADAPRSLEAVLARVPVRVARVRKAAK